MFKNARRTIKHLRNIPDMIDSIIDLQHQVSELNGRLESDRQELETCINLIAKLKADKGRR